jgi:hypothetical protein
MERDQKLPHLERITEGDVVVGIASSGLHSNGFSLVRKIVAKSSLKYSSAAPDGCGDQTLGKLTHCLAVRCLSNHFVVLVSRYLKLEWNELHFSVVFMLRYCYRTDSHCPFQNCFVCFGFVLVG